MSHVYYKNKRKNKQIQPPYELMKFRPLAELYNAIVASFNDLRCCAPVDLVDLVIV